MYSYVLTYFLFIATLFAIESPQSSVVRTGTGFIDYSNRVIVSRGTASIVSNEKAEKVVKEPKIPIIKKYLIKICEKSLLIK